jgi:hypothetical protein
MMASSTKEMNNLTHNFHHSITYEQERLKTLLDTRILDSNPNDTDFDRYTSLSARIFNVPCSNIIMVDTDTIFFKSRHPHQEELTKKIPRKETIAQHFLSIDSPDVIVIPDILEHEEYKDKQYPILSGENNRFVAMATIIVDGMRLGFLTITDLVPRHDFNLAKRMSLLDFAASISVLINDRRRSYLNLEIIKSLETTIRILRKDSSQSNVNTKERQLTLENLELVERQLLESGIGGSKSPRSLKKTASEEDSLHEFRIDDDDGEAVLAHMGNCVRCNIFEIIAQAKVIIKRTLQTLPDDQEDGNPREARKRISWIVNRTYLDCGLHISYPDAILYVLTSSTCHLLSYWKYLNIRIGFKKTHTLRNHKQTLQRNKPLPGVMDGNLIIEIHFDTLLSAHSDLVSLTAPPSENPSNHNNHQNPFSAYLEYPSSSDSSVSTRAASVADENYEASSPSRKKSFSHQPQDMVKDRYVIKLDKFEPELFDFRMYADKFHCIDHVLRDIRGSSRYSQLYETSVASLIDPSRNMVYDFDLKSVSTHSHQSNQSSATSSGASGTRSHELKSLKDKFDFHDESMITDRFYDYSIPCLISIPIIELDGRNGNVLPSDIQNKQAKKYTQLKILLLTTSKTSWMKTLLHYLRSQGHDAHVSYIAEEGLELLKFTHFDIAFVDVSMVSQRAFLYLSIHLSCSCPCKLKKTTVSETPMIELYYLWTNQAQVVPQINLDMLIIGITNDDTVGLASIQVDSLAITESMHFYFPNPAVNMEMLLYIMAAKRKYMKIDAVCAAIDRKINRSGAGTATISTITSASGSSSQSSRVSVADDSDLKELAQMTLTNQMDAIEDNVSTRTTYVSVAEVENGPSKKPSSNRGGPSVRFQSDSFVG